MPRSPRISASGARRQAERAGGLQSGDHDSRLEPGHEGAAVGRDVPAVCRLEALARMATPSRIPGGPDSDRRARRGKRVDSRAGQAVSKCSRMAPARSVRSRPLLPM